jgi:hypothetical protein
LAQWAISYEDLSTCTFCRFGAPEEVHPDCQKQLDWQRLELGTLDCAYSKWYFRHNFDKCIVEDKIQCGPIKALLEEHKLPSYSIAILQVDVEGYEHVLLPGLMNELSDDTLPAVIHFEHKMLREYDRISNFTTTREEDIYAALRIRGYVLYNQGWGDMLALRVGERKDTRERERETEGILGRPVG